MPKNKALFPGTFDPFTLGHLEIVKQAYKDFDEIHIVIMENEEKTPYFDLKKRIDIIKALNLSKVIVGYWGKYASDYCNANNIYTIIRGYRNNKDLAYEKELAKLYKKCSNKINVKLYKTNLNISSTKVKKMIKQNKDYQHLVPKGDKNER